MRLSAEIPNAPFQPGDIVYLASGSAPLTILVIVGDKAAVTWPHEDGRQLHIYPLVCLRRDQNPRWP